MAILSRDELFNKIKVRIGEDTSDEAISLLEDLNDTLTDLTTKANGDGVNWQEKYNELDSTWRKKYRDRFFAGKDEPDPDVDDPLPDEVHNNPKTYDELFNVKE